MQLTQGLKEEITIHALGTKVWNVLTSPHYTKQYLFDGELISDWISGSSILYKFEREGNAEVVYQGKVLHIVPGISLQFTFPAIDNPEAGNSTLSYELIPHSNGIQLKLTNEVIYQSEELYKIMLQNWRMVLQKIKWLAEYA
jgi:uncharacterized protein YndB with AHSA1/START domain